jgi:tellurite resistance protein
MSENPNRLAFFPITLFGSIMGYSGLTLILIGLHQILDIAAWIPAVFVVLTTLFFSLISATYLMKIIRFPQAMIKEFNHPVAINFFPALSISLVLLGVIYSNYDLLIGQIFWTLGASLQFVLTVIIVSNWVHHEKWQITHMSPAWFIPAVGNIIVPLGTPLYAPLELGWFFFSVGLIFWIILQAIVMYRLFFHPPMLKALEPTLFILIAPPAIGFSSYLHLIGGELDVFARILYYTALFFALMLLVQTPRFLKIPFSLSWWAYTFPLAALGLASLKMFALLNMQTFSLFMALFTALVSALIFHLTLKTFSAIRHKKLCVPPPAAPNPTNGSAE